MRSAYDWMVWAFRVWLALCAIGVVMFIALGSFDADTVAGRIGIVAALGGAFGWVVPALIFPLVD